LPEPKEPPVIQKETEKEPAVVTVARPRPAAEPAEIPRLTETKPAVDELMGLTVQSLNREADRREQKKSPFDRFIIEPGFSQEKSWKQFSAIYPIPGLFANEAATEIFKREIVSKNLYRRIHRAVSRYRTYLNQSGKEVALFSDWFSVWTAWED
jgi:hypothetical protein